VGSFSSCGSLVSDHGSESSFEWEDKCVLNSVIDKIEPTTALEATEVAYPEGYDIKFQQAVHDSLQSELAYKIWKWRNEVVVEDGNSSTEQSERRKGCYCGENRCEWAVAQSISGDPEYRGWGTNTETSSAGTAAGGSSRHQQPWFYSKSYKARDVVG